MRKFQAHDLVEAKNPLRVVAQRLRSRDDADFASAYPDEPPHQRASGSPRGDVVDADVMMATRTGHVGYERDDIGSPSDEIVDRGANALVIEGHDGDPVIAPGQRFQ